MREAVIIDTARTAIGKAYRGAFNNTEAPALGGHVISAMMARQDLDPGLIDDVVMGAAAQQGTQGRSCLASALCEVHAQSCAMMLMAPCCEVLRHDVCCVVCAQHFAGL